MSARRPTPLDTAASADPAARDMSKSAQAAAEDKFRKLVEGSVQGIAVHRDFRFQFANQATATMLGFNKPEDLVGLDVLQVIPVRFREEAIRLYDALLRGEPVPNPIESEILRRDGTPIWVERIHTRIDWEGEPALLATMTDITQRKRAEAQLREAMAEVERLKNRLQAENVYLRDEIRREHRFDYIKTNSPAMRRVLDQIGRVAATTTTVLILGESGTGKELVARAIHDASPRSDRPLVTVNCAALPAHLIESELFGHEKGAFTGAVARKLGRFELADRGTIFLDEIGDLPIELQAKLLRVLQESEFERLGATSTRKVDVRVIAATNRDLVRMVREGKFREDLYYRLNVFPTHLPPLRERKEDLPMLVEHFLAKHSPRIGRKVNAVHPALMKALRLYNWPGNVRELENVIERAIILSQGEMLKVDALLDLTQVHIEASSETKTWPEAEQALILDALQSCGWKIEGIRGTAQRLDMPPSTLREKMRKYGLKRP